MDTKNSTLLSIAIALLCISCNRGSSEHTLNEKPIEVEAISLNEKNSEQRITSYSATVVAGKTIDLSFLVSGTLKQLPVEVGTFVRQGQLIAEIDDAIYQNQYLGQKAQATLAQENYERTQQVFQKGSIAEIRLLEARSQYEQAQAAMNAAQKNLSYAQLKAPTSGYIGHKLAEIGNTVGPGTPIVQLLDIARLKIEVPVPDAEINTIKKGDEALVHIPSLQLDKLKGVVDEVSVSAGQGSPTYLVRVLLPPSEKGIKPGMVANVQIKGSETSEAMADSSQTNALLVPTQSVQVDENGKHFVFVISADGKRAERRTVSTGKLFDNGISILDGLTTQDRLITSGYHKLSDSTLIHISN